MKINKLLQLSLASVAAFAISPVGGVAMAQGDHHHRYHDNYACYEVNIDNENDVELESTTVQNATSGDITIDGNTTVEDVESGAARNTQTTDVSIDIDNSSGVENLPAPVAPTNNNGHHHRGYGMNIDIDNENDIEIANTVEQTATSGSVTVTDNTTVGDVTTGAATNTSTSTFSISILQ